MVIGLPLAKNDSYKAIWVVLMVVFMQPFMHLYLYIISELPLFALDDAP